eukprot:1023255-Pelagomonas_calceolata.AAC.8
MVNLGAVCAFPHYLVPQATSSAWHASAHGKVYRSPEKPCSFESQATPQGQQKYTTVRVKGGRIMHVNSGCVPEGRKLGVPATAVVQFKAEPVVFAGM